jgi:hypothetical protein
MKDDVISMVECFSVFFYVVKDYGFAIGVAVKEGFAFGICSFELYFRVVIGLATTPYYESYLPGVSNIVSDPNQQALFEALAFYDQSKCAVSSLFFTNSTQLSSAFRLPLIPSKNLAKML